MRTPRHTSVGPKVHLCWQVRVDVALRVTFERALAIGGSRETSHTRTVSLDEVQRHTLLHAVRAPPERHLAVVVNQFYPKFVKLPSVADAQPLALTGDSYRWHTLQTLRLGNSAPAVDSPFAWLLA